MNLQKMTNASWCDTESIYLALNAPVSGSQRTLPALLEDDPNASLFRYLFPSIFLSILAINVFFGRFFPRTIFTFLGCGTGFAVSQGILFGRPNVFPSNVSCGTQWGAGVGGVLIGGLLFYLLTRYAVRLESFCLGGLFAYSIFHQYPQLDQMETGFPGMDDIDVLFLGFGFVAWLSILVACFLFFFLFCWENVKAFKVALLIATSGGWSMSQNVRSLTKNLDTLEDTIPLVWTVVLFAVSFVLILLFEGWMIWRAKKAVLSKELRERDTPLPRSNNEPNTVRLIHR